MPHIKGPKAHAVSGLLRVLPEGSGEEFIKEETNSFTGVPETGVNSADDFYENELEPHFFVPNFLRPLPEAENEAALDAEDGLKRYNVASDAIYLVPGMLPEPYWDFNMVCDQFNYA